MTVASSTRRPTALVIGPLPPPFIGPAVGTKMVIGAFERAGVRVAHVNTQDRRSVMNMGVFDVKNVALGLVHAVRTAGLAALERPDVVYIPISQGRWGYIRDAVLMAILRLQRRAFVVHIRGSEFRDFYGAAPAWERFVIRRTLAWAARGIVLTPNLTCLYDGLVPSARVRILENAIIDPYPTGIDDLVDARRSRALGTPRGLRLLYMANDWGMKGAMTLVRSVATAGLEDVELRLAGSPFPRDLEAVRRLAADLGVAQRIDVLGPISGAAKAAQFAWADALVHPTEAWDGQPIVIIEAMAAGLPIVSTEYAGIPHTVGEAGLIVPPRAPERLGAALRSLVDDPALRVRLGEMSRKRYLARYAPEPYQRRFEALFGELVRLPCAG